MPHPVISANHVAVITGGASGIGLAAATRFAEAGMKVCIADLGNDRLKAAAAKLSSAAPDGAADIMTAAVDVSRADDVAGLEAAVARPVYYELAELALDEAHEPPGLWSDGVFFPLATA